MGAEGPGRVRASGPRWLLWVRVVALASVFLAGLAVVLYALHITSEPRVDDPAQRDMIYFGIHGAALGGAMLGGFVLGAILRTSAALTAIGFLLLMLVALMAAQAGSYELACRGHNDLIRHWEC